MANIDYPKAIKSLELSYNILPKKPESLSKSDLKTLGEACSLYLKFYELFVGASTDPRIEDAYSFQKFVIDSEIENLVNKFKEAEEKEKEKEKKPKEQEASIPPELESMVAEYKENQALLESEEIKTNSQRSVAEQVKIAIAHQKIKDLALANHEHRLAKGEKLLNPDVAFASLGSPKAETKTSALAASYSATKQVALTYNGFQNLSPQVQNEIITSAVELNTIGIADLDTAIQAATLQLNIADLEETDKKYLATIPGGFVSSVYKEVTTSNETTLKYEANIAANEEKILELQKLGKIDEAQSLIEENQHLAAFVENQSVRLINTIAKQTESFRDFEKSRETRLSQDPDLKDKIEEANKAVATLQNNLERNGVEPHIYTPMDDAYLLEQAIRKDMPGTLLPFADYEAEYAAAIISHPKTQDPNFSPQAILLYSKDLTSDLFTKARQFAQKNPNSSLGKLYQTRKDIFHSVGNQLRKITGSTLGKEISSAKTGLGKALNSVSKSFGKISDRLGNIGTVVRVVQNPWGALRSWAGKKAGQLLIKQIGKHLTSETAQLLLKNGLKEGVKKLIAEAAVKAAIKLGIKTGTKLALETAAQTANVIPGLGIVLAIAIEILWWVGEKTLGYAKKVFDNVTTSIYGEKIKARDLLAIPVAGVAAATVGVITFIGGLATATYIAAKSATGIIILGTFIGFFFYVTSIVVAPLISTLVNLDTTYRVTELNCDNTSLTNDKKLCKTYHGTSYCFPVNDITTINYATAHHDYYAVDIFRNGDIPGPADDIPLPILAYVGGEVIWISQNDSLGGYSFIIAGVDGFFYYYAHNMCNLVTEGQIVAAGDVIAGMDSTGNAKSTPEHLHFQIGDQADMSTIPENYPHFFPPWEDFCEKLGLCGPQISN